MIDFVGLDGAAAATRTLALVAAALAGAEWLFLRVELGAGGFADPGILRRRAVWSGTGAGRFLDGAGPATAAAAGQTGAALLAVACPIPEIRLGLLAVVLACHLFLLARINVGFDGSDRMLTILLVGVVCIEAVPTPHARHAALWFVGAHGILAYAAGGLAKVRSPMWLSGEAVSGVLGTRSVGHRALAGWAVSHPGATQAVARSTIALECALPVLAFAGPAGAVAMVVGGTAFHAATALAMGLNRFPWVFLATYPAILHLASSLTW